MVPLIYFKISNLKVLLKGLLVLAVLLLAYVFVGVAAASAVVTVLDWAAVRGTDNGVYAASFLSDGSWSSWQWLGGYTLSPPGICEDPGVGTVYVAVREQRYLPLSHGVVVWDGLLVGRLRVEQQ